MDPLVHEIAEECGPHTMLPRERLLETIAFMLQLAADPDFPAGDVLECGTWRGGMALVATRIFGPSRRYAFYDSFEGLPPPGPRDGEDSHWWAAHPEHPRYFDNCRADYEEMRSLMTRARPGYSISVTKGSFSETLHPEPAAPIAWVHLDCDWYDSTYLCLERLWPHMAVGGVIAVDDYYDWEGCRRAVHDFLSHRGAREAIDRIGRHGGIAMVRLGPWDLRESPHLN